MSDDEQEKKTHQFAIDKCKGRVLIAGLGLGYAIEKLAEKEDVTQIVVVEKSPEVIELIWKHIKTYDKCRIVCDDIFDYLKKATGFDYMYLDIWKDTNERAYKNLMKLRALAERILPSDKVLCWEEIKMRKQNG